MSHSTLGAVQSAEWAEFLGNAIGGLHVAADDLKLRRAKYEAKKDWFRKGKTGIPQEEAVSRALADLFAYRRAQQALSDPADGDVDLRHISIACETPRPLDPGISKQAKPTDYTIILMRESELDLRIEAKTVLDEREIKAEYLGLRGLKRFDDASNPYTISSYGGMVAYVVNHDAPTWSTKISTALLAEIGTDRAGSIELGAREHHISKHSVPVATREMTGNIEVNVVHFVLEVEASPSRRT